MESGEFVPGVNSRIVAISEPAETRQALQSSIEAVQGLVERHQGWLIHLAAAYLRDLQSAEDCVQDVFVTALRKLDMNLPESSQKNWLATCTVNRARSMLRSFSIRRLILVDRTDLLDRGSGRRDDYAGLDESGVLARVMELPLKYREVIILRYYHDMSTSQTAGILGIPESTVKTRIARGMEKLRMTIRPDGGEC